MRSTPSTAATKWISVARSAGVPSGIGVHILAEQGYFAYALRGQAPYFLDHLFERPADLFAARVPYDAKTAVLAAAFHDGDERGRSRSPRLRELVEFLDLRETDI